MNFTYIEDSRVASLAIDLVEKVRCMLRNPRVAPEQIFVVGIGESGLKIAAAFLSAAYENDELKELKLNFRALDKRNVVPADKFGWTIPGEDDSTEFNSAKELDGLQKTAILLVDGVVRSGRTLLSVYKAVTARVAGNAEEAAKNRISVWSYAIAVNPNSSIIPTWFGTLYSPNTYVVLSRDLGTPNVSILEITTKVAEGEPPGPVSYPPVVLRAPEEKDCEFHVTFPDSMNRYRSVDRYFDHQTKSRRVFVVEVFNKAVGYISFHVERRVLWLDYILIGDNELKELKDQGVNPGSALIRFVASYAQSVGCIKLGAWAISTKLDFYQKRGFQMAGADPIAFNDGNGDEKYLLIIMQLDSGKQQT